MAVDTALARARRAVPAMIVIVRAFANDSNSNFFSPNFYHALSTHWHIGISCFLPRGMVIQLLQLLKIVCLRHRSPA